MTINNAFGTSQYGFGLNPSGLDTASIVTKLVGIRSQTLTAMQTNLNNASSAASTVSTFASHLSALSSAASDLSFPTGFNATGASSSDSSYVTASPSYGGVPGSYSLDVAHLASEQRTRSNTFASSSTALGLSGSLSVQVGSGTPVSLTIAGTDTLNDIATKISSAGLRVNASVIYDGSNYRMLVRGLDTGASNAVTLTEGSPALASALGLSTPANTYQHAQDSAFTVDGVSMTRPTNQISGAIPGVTMALVRPTTSSVTVSVTTDSSTVAANVQAFVNAYNRVVYDSHNATGYGGQKASNPLLQSDRVFRSALDQMSNLVGSVVPGTSGAYTTLRSVGVSLQNDGTLSFSSSTFAAAMTADPTAVSKIFVTDASNGSTGVMSSFRTVVNGFIGTSSSPANAEASAMSQRATAIQAQIRDEQARITTYQTNLQTQFTNMEINVAKYKAMLNG